MNGADAGFPPAPCPAESKRQSVYSPGVVRDGERLCRVVHQLQAVVGSGLGPAAFPVKDLCDAERAGISVIRINGMTASECQRLVRTAFDRPAGWTWLGTGTATCGRIRNILHDGARAFCVVDDGKPGFETHALIRLRDPKSRRSLARRLRASLLSAFRYLPEDHAFRRKHHAARTHDAEPR